MSLAESRFQQCPTQTAVLELALQSLIERLIAAGTLRDDDLAAMRADGLRFARDLTSNGTTVIPPPLVALERRIRDWWDRFDAPPVYANDP
jgi:hypothetical protein